LAERAKVIDTEAPAMEEQIRSLKAEIANLTSAIAAGGGVSPAALVEAIRQREESLAVLEGRIRGLKTVPDIIGLETRRMEREARERLANFQQLHQNGVELEDPRELLYDMMIGAATKTIGKAEIASTLRSLVVPPTE
jgi:hypothetical protein